MLQAVRITEPLDRADATETALFEALDCLRTGITVFDRDERLVYCNEHYRYLFRSCPSVGVLIGRTYEALIRMEIANGEIAGNAVIADPDSLVADRLAHMRYGEYRPYDLRLSDGRLVEIKARRTRSGGWVALWCEATHARQTLDRLEDVISLSADAFAFWDQADRLVLCNAHFAELHGAASEQTLFGRTFLDIVRESAERGLFLVPEDIESWVATRRAAHRKPAGVVTISMPDGKSYLVKERRTRDGGRATVLTDATAHHRMEVALAEQTRTLARAREALARTRSEAKRKASYLAELSARLNTAEAHAEAAKTALLRTMSHELRSPLNAIMGFSDLLRARADKLSHEQIRDYAGAVHEGGGRLLKLINQLVDLSKIAAGRYPLEREPVAAAGALAAAAQCVEDAARSCKVELVSDLPDPSLKVQADEQALAAALSYLVDNAVKHGRPAGTVHLSAKADGGRVVFRVADDGPGIPDTDKPRMFEPFAQGTRAKEHHGGAGLGLTLARALVELHGGTITLADAPEGGLAVALALARA